MTQRDGASGPLAGIRVLELGTMIAGPVVGTLLGDFGAEVIKVEQPDGGDPIRNIGPFCEGEGLWWNVEGRNKKSVTLDLRQPEGQEIRAGEPPQIPFAEAELPADEGGDHRIGGAIDVGKKETGGKGKKELEPEHDGGKC